MDLNITTLLSDTSVPDDVLAEVPEACKALGLPGKPISRRTLSRYINQPDGLECVEVAGRHYIRIGALRNRVRSQLRHPNQRRGGRNARAS